MPIPTVQPLHVVKVKTTPADQARLSAVRTPDLPFDTGWQPPSLNGIENLTVRGDKLSSMIGPRIIAADLTNSLDEPCALVLQVWDKERELLKSGLLDTKIRFGLGDQAYAMTRVSKSGDMLTLEFEDANVNALRAFTTPRKSTRGSVTRVGFVKSLLQEKGTPGLQLYIDAGNGQVTVEENPEALVPHKQRRPGAWSKVTVKGVQATAEQLDNIKVVLDTLYDLGASRRHMIATVMCVTDESVWHNSSTQTNADSVGLFQQKASQVGPGLKWGEGGTNRVNAASVFYRTLKADDERVQGQISLTLLIHAVQGNNDPNVYAQYEDESTKTVSAYMGKFGSGQTPATTKLYEFRRGGLDGTLEDTWVCTGRLADEVQYRRFVVDGVFYFLPDDLLVSGGPRLLLTETTPGMLSPIDFDMDEAVDPATCTFSIHGDHWYAPPGTCIEIDECGPANGVWLVNKVSASLLQPFDQEIELVRPRAVLTEPPATTTADLAVETGGGRETSVTTGKENFSNALSGAGSRIGFSGYTSPFPPGTVVLNAERIDQGVDYAVTPNAPLVAISDGIVIGITPNWYAHQPYMWYRVTNGDHAGRYIYYSEGLTLLVSKGQSFKAGDVIARTTNQPTGLEFGFAQANGSVLTPYNGAPDGTAMEGGKMFARFLISLGVKVRDDPGPGPD